MAARSWFGLVLALIWVAIFSSAAQAQQGGIYGPRANKQQQQQQQQAKQDLHGKGQMEAVGNGVFKAVLDGDPWVIKLEKNAKVMVKGTATADFLMPGLFVKFKGDIDKKGKAAEQVKELEIFTPSENDPLGATPTGNALDASTLKKTPSVVPSPYDIAGRISAIKKGAIIVACPGMTVHAEVAPDAKVKVNVADLSFASPGDKMEAKGWFIKGKEGYAYASEVTVDMANPLTGPKKKVPLHATKSADKSTDSAAVTPDAKKPDKAANGPDPKAADDKKPDDTKTADKDKADATK
ncbi:MAG TPA: hypothetical protein VG056_05565 [Pirellulales bacterium]|nr:hypothetical protein [Pirellulales bacterium]